MGILIAESAVPAVGIIGSGACPSVRLPLTCRRALLLMTDPGYEVHSDKCKAADENPSAPEKSSDHAKFNRARLQLGL